MSSSTLSVVLLAAQSDSGVISLLIRWVLHPLALVLVPLGCFIIAVSYIERAWKRGSQLGLRALAASVLPLVVATFIYMTQPSLFVQLAEYAGAGGFFAAFIVGFLVLFLSRTGGDIVFPVGAFCAAGILSVLIFTYVSVRDPRSYVFFYGVATGILAHLAFLGLGPGSRDK